MPLMLAIRDAMELENFVEMKEVVLERYNAEDSITQFNRNSRIKHKSMCLAKVIMLNGTLSRSLNCHFYGRLQQTDVHTRAQSGQSSPLAELRRLL